MLTPSDKIDAYELIAPLGRGGMAKLYLARKRGAGGFSRLVTLKFVHDHLSSNEDIIRLFLQEARLSSLITHPNVVRVEDVGRCGDSYFIAMEYVHGVSLAELLACVRLMRVQLPPALYLWISAQIAEALHAAHEARGENGAPLGIVHHDVSPENVLVSDSGHVKLIDFGIARSWAETEDENDKAAVRGKLRYMAPEQLLKDPADRRADVYALGVMLWEMLTGRNLLRCRRVDDVRDWETRSDPPLPSHYNISVPQALDRAVRKALECEPDARYRDALQFRAALLQADPEAARLDAPSVAQLLAPVLSRALSRRRLHGTNTHTRPAQTGARAHEPTRSLDGIAMKRCCTQPVFAASQHVALGWPYGDGRARHAR
jgi:eukaryotic-like serine/threonine-protein kinase